MDKEAVLSWLAEAHRLQRTYKLHYPNIPAIGHFIMFTNEFRWNTDCQQEMVELGVAAGLHFFDYMARQHAGNNRGGCGIAHAELLEGNNGGVSERNCSSWGHSPQHSSGNGSGSTLQTISTSESCASNGLSTAEVESLYYSCWDHHEFCTSLFNARMYCKSLVQIDWTCVMVHGQLKTLFFFFGSYHSSSQFSIANSTCFCNRNLL